MDAQSIQQLPDLGERPPATEDITGLLEAWGDGDVDAADELLRRVSGRLRRLAGSFLVRERQNHTLQTTELIHEAYLRLSGRGADWEGREHFFAIAATVMRQVLVDDVRRRTSQKRGGQAEKVSLDEAGDGARLEAAPDVDLLALDEALSQLGAVDPRKSRIVELRFFAGLTIAETAKVLELSTATVERDLRIAKAWLSQSLRG